MTSCARCDWEGGDAEEHARESGHLRCVVCQRRSLTEFEAQTCGQCVSQVRDDLDAVVSAYADLTATFTEGTHRQIRPDILAILADGSTQGGGPDDAISFHDPCSAAAELERIERDWRAEFGHGTPDYPVLGAGKWQSRRPAHVFAEAHAYLRTWNSLAARTHPGFDDFATEIRDLRSRLEHSAGIADDPRRDPIPCGCGGRLVQDYGETGLTDERRCRDCGTVYPSSDYAFHLRLLTDTAGWVSVQQAADAVGRPVVTIKAWIARLDLPAVCNRLTRRMLVDEQRAHELAEERPTRRRSA